MATNREYLIQALQNKDDNEETMNNLECPRYDSYDCLHAYDDTPCWKCKSMWLDKERGVDGED